MIDPHTEYINLQEKYGNNKYMIQEDITQIDHCLQAAYIAHLCGAPEDVVIGLLYHDIGQLVGRQDGYIDGDKNKNFDINYLHEHHDDLGSMWLEEREFPNFVYDLVNYHTLAKVVLCDRDPDYFNNLSKASQISYHFQKEKFKEKIKTKEDYQQFLKHKRLEDILAARLCDDMAKIPDFKDIPGLENYRDMVKRVLYCINENKNKNYNNWIEKIKKLKKWVNKDRQSFENAIKSKFDMFI